LFVVLTAVARCGQTRIGVRCIVTRASATHRTGQHPGSPWSLISPDQTRLTVGLLSAMHACYAVNSQSLVTDEASWCWCRADADWCLLHSSTHLICIQNQRLQPDRCRVDRCMLPICAALLTKLKPQQWISFRININTSEFVLLLVRAKMLQRPVFYGRHYAVRRARVTL